MENKKFKENAVVVIEKIYNFLFNPKNITLIFIMISILLGVLVFYKNTQISKLKSDVAIQNQNIVALHDTIVTVKNKAGQYQQEKKSFIASIKQLKNLNSDLYKEVNKQKDQVIFISMLNASLKTKIDSLSKENKSLKDSLSVVILANGDTLNIIRWNLSKVYDVNNSRTIEGKSKFLYKNNKVVSMGSELDKFDINFNIVTGLSESDDKQLVIWAKSDYPNLSFNNITGSLIDPKKSSVLKKLMPQNKWVFGPMMGVGVGYNNGHVLPVYVVGIGVVYRIFGF